MEEKKYLRFCPKHGPLGEDASACPRCGRETVLSDVTETQYKEWQNSKDDEEKRFPFKLQGAMKADPDKIVKDLRSGKKGKVLDAISILAWRPEREEYIPEVADWWGKLGGNHVTFFLSRCSAESVRPYLDFRHYNCMDKYSVQLFMPLFIDHYKHQKSLPCEKCGRETNNLFFKITTTKNEGGSVRKGSWVYTELRYTGHAVPHAYCEECALKKADKKKKLRDRSGAEKIRAWMNFNSDINTKNCGDANDFMASLEMDTPGFGYDYLISPAAMEEMKNNKVDGAVLAAMIDCALELKNTLAETE